LFDIARLQWDEELCELWRVPMAALPEVRESSSRFGTTTLSGLLKKPVPICGVMGDSQAAMFAQRCFDPGTAKVTFGTGSSVLVNIGNTPKFSSKGVVTSLGWVRGGQPVYAFEGIIISSAATLDWLKNQLELVADVNELAALASEVPDSAGVYLVPAFSGLGLPHWEADARAAIVGLSAHSTRRHVARAALESMTYQLQDALTAISRESGVSITELKVDGGPTANEMLMQFTADVTQLSISASVAPDCSALGAALMGLLGLGVFSSVDEIARLPSDNRTYKPAEPDAVSVARQGGWQRAVRQVLAGVQD
jgi:glycerol kinase